MTPISVTIACKKCRQVFAPDVKTRKAWRCGACNAKNPNLRRHYRSVADLMILGLLLTVIVVAVVATTKGVTFGVALMCLHSIVLLTSIVVIYRAATPWMDRTANVLMWMVFIIAFTANIVLPYLAYRRIGGPIIVYALLFSYLFWLKRAAAIAVPPSNA